MNYLDNSLRKDGVHQMTHSYSVSYTNMPKMATRQCVFCVLKLQNRRKTRFEFFFIFRTGYNTLSHTQCVCRKRRSEQKMQKMITMKYAILNAKHLQLLLLWAFLLSLLSLLLQLWFLSWVLLSWIQRLSLWWILLLFVELRKRWKMS